MRQANETSGEPDGRGMDVVPRSNPPHRSRKNMRISSENMAEARPGTRTPNPFITSEVLYRLS